MTTKKKRSRSRSLVRARKRAQAEGPLLEQQQQAHDWQPHHHHYHDHRYCTTPPTNPLGTISCFQVFVEQQGLLDPSELASFWTALQRPLPTNFRIRSGLDSVATREWYRLVHECRLDAWPIDGIAGAWQLQPNSGGEIPAVRAWLARHTKTGAISRQELVSMLPVALLQIQAHHAVLDLCASPGSKTVQAVDDLYCSSGGIQSSSLPSGYVVANELNARRSHILAHRARQTLGNRHVSLAIVCHNATKFPNVQAPLVRCGQQPTTGGTTIPSYDRIICDVPCSGDGVRFQNFLSWQLFYLYNLSTRFSHCCLLLDSPQRHQGMEDLAPFLRHRLASTTNSYCQARNRSPQGRWTHDLQHLFFSSSRGRGRCSGTFTNGLRRSGSARRDFTQFHSLAAWSWLLEGVE